MEGEKVDDGDDRFDSLGELEHDVFAGELMPSVLLVVGVFGMWLIRLGLVGLSSQKEV